MQRNNIDVRLLVKGRPITEYFHNGQTFVEGRDGRDFEIELVNRNGFRVEAIISVDGLSVLDGKEASDRSSGYLLEAGQTLRVPGWKLDNQTVAKFFFAGKASGQTYEQQITGNGGRNGGVIGVLAYKEKVTNYRGYTNAGYLANAFPGGVKKMTSSGNPRGMRGISKGIAPSGPNTAGHYDPNFTYTSCDLSTPLGSSIVGSTMSLNNAAVQTSFSPDIAVASATVATPEVNNLGTGFGEATSFATTQVSFQRGDMLCVAVLYYDNSRGLKARGIQLGRPSRVRYNQQPQAFPGMQTGCTPPSGWNG